MMCYLVEKSLAKGFHFRYDFLVMVPMNDETKQSIEPLFLSRACESGTSLRIGQMNRTEHDGIIREIGRYDINIEESGKIVTLLKQEISYISAPRQILIPSSPHSDGPVDQHTAGASQARPNIQQEFLDKAVKENQPLTIFLVNGQRIKANVEAYDNFTLLLREGEKQHLYYKHAITTINR